jgi:hypothetical protein
MQIRPDDDPHDRTPDDEDDETPETPPDEPRPPRIEDPPAQTDGQGPYVVADLARTRAHSTTEGQR